MVHGNKSLDKIEYLTEILLKTVLNTINLATLFPSAEGAVVVMIIW
jgi:hypothetical protein